MAEMQHEPLFLYTYTDQAVDANLYHALIHAFVNCLLIKPDWI